VKNAGSLAFGAPAKTKLLPGVHCLQLLDAVGPFAEETVFLPGRAIEQEDVLGA